MTPEGKVKAHVKRLLDKYGEDSYREMPVPGGFGKSGLDFNVCFFGVWISIETKRPGETLTPRQIDTKRRIERAGGKVFGVDGTENPKEDLHHSMRKFSELESYLEGIAAYARSLKKAA